MKNLYRIALIIAILLFCFNPESTSISFAEETTDKEVRVGFYNFAPLTIIDQNNQAQGLFVDLLNKVAEKESWDVTYIPGSFPECIKRLDNNEIDILIAFGYSDERAEIYDFTDETIFLEWGLIYTPYATDIQNILDLDGKRVATLKGSLAGTEFINLADSFGLHVDIVEKEEYADVFSAIANKEVDAGINGNLTGLAMEGNYAVERSTIMFSPIKIKYAVKKGLNSDLLKAIDKHIGIWKNDDKSTYYSTYDKWVGIAETQEFPTWVYFVGLLLFIMMMGLYVFNKILRQSIKTKTSELVTANNDIQKTLATVLESENKYSSYLENAPDGIFIANKEGRYVEVNKAASRITGFSKEELLKTSISSLLPYESQEAGLTEFKELMEKGSVKGKPLQFIRKDGSTGWWTIDAVKLSEDRYLGFAKDISDKKNTEIKLIEEEQRYRILFNNESDPLFVLDKQTGAILEANNAACRVYGYTVDEFWKMKNTDVSAEPELTRQAMQLLKEGMTTIPVRYHKTKNGRIFPVEITANVIRLKESEVMLVSIRDITERMKSEEKLKEDENRFREVLKSLHAGVVVHAPDSTIIDCNERAEEMLGLSRDQLLGKAAIDPRWQFQREDGSQMPLEEFPVVLVLSNKKPIKDMILASYQPDINRTRWLTVNGTPIYNQLGEIVEAVISFIDITDQKSAEKLLLKQLKDFLESQRIAHIGTWRLTLATNEVVWSEELYKMYRFDPSLPVPPYTEHMKLFTKESWDTLAVSIEKARTSGLPYELELEIVLKDGTNGWMWVRGEAEKDSQGNIVSLWGAAQDITERKKNENQILYMGYHDQLTGLHNRRFYEEELIRLNIQRNLPLTIAMADVNGLKLINDSFGHAIGDEVLRKAADLITKCCREDDIVARLGGDEFGIIFPKTDSNSAEEVISRIKLMATNLKMDPINISISFGHETKNLKEENIVDIIKRTEDHMYRHKLYESSSMRSKTIDLIMNTLYEKNNREMLHSKRVSRFCEMIATKMNFDKDDINQMSIAGMMHDIGKIGIDEKILNKDAQLNNEEWVEMKRHPEIGYRVLSSVNEFSEIAEYVLEHQEKWDGTGYPRGLQGEEISIQARIITIADAYDAMTTERTYSHALSKEAAMTEIKKCAGTQFDPEIVNVFIESVIPNYHQHGIL
jgi:diguanylate cyclase (GGDEF)-like protein/PAS domain S-box-containing protein